MPRVAFTPHLERHGSTTGSLWLSEDAGDSFSCLSAHLPPVYAVCFA